MAAPLSTRSLPCANTGSETKPSPCRKTASNPCSGCRLVQYCSIDCQHAHWPIHKSDCRSPLMESTWKPAWEVEKRKPSFIGNDDSASLMTSHGQRKYLWGNVPAIDILNLKQNEGVDVSADLRLLFAASGDLRNIVKTVAKIPASYIGSCDIIVNDKDADIVARNAILLLVALRFPPAEVAPLMLHVWYSVLLPARMFALLRNHITPLFDDVCSEIRQQPEDWLHSKTWVSGSSSLRLVLQKRQWDGILQYLRIPDRLTADKAQQARRATMLAPDRNFWKDYVDRVLFNLPPAWRVGMMKFLKDGILLPFGSSREDFDTPNPTFFRSKDFWPMIDSANPLQVWPLKDIIRHVPAAGDDIYGGMFLFVTNVLTTFCQRLKDLKVSFTLFQMNATQLPGILNEGGRAQKKFDRIEVSNIADRCHLSLSPILSHLAPLLYPSTTHPHAKLINLFRNAIRETRCRSHEVSTATATMSRVQKYLPPLPPGDGISADKASGACIQMVAARVIFWDFDDMFEKYMKEVRFDMVAWTARAVMKAKHTVVGKWPLRLKDGAPKEEFNLLLASGHMGCERYVEWKLSQWDLNAIASSLEAVSPVNSW